MAAEDVVAKLESRLPAALPAGTASAVFCCGYCYGAEITGVAILVDGERHVPAAARMPRPDLAHADPRAFRSGFWGVVPVAARRPGPIELALVVGARGGERAVPLGSIAVVEPEPPPAGPRDPALVAICMATYEPDLDLLRAQVESLRAQTDPSWRCVISDDASSPERFEALRELVAGDERFAVSRAPERLGFYRNFERALRLAPPEAGLLALCDQDDRWHPDKLAVLRAALGSAQLVYCDQRLVDTRGRVLRETLWEGRANNHASLASLLVANTITGAAALFRRDVADLALPFPDAPGLQFHDHWIGLVALAGGDVAYVDRPLYDYVQHGGAVLGEVRGEARSRGLLRGGRGAYFLGYLPREVQARTLLARCDGRLTRRKRRALRRYVRAARSPTAFAWLLLRPLRALTGATETLGSELELAHGIAWRWLVVLLAAVTRGRGPLTADASVPDLLSFEQRRLRRWRARP